MNYIDKSITLLSEVSDSPSTILELRGVATWLTVNETMELPMNRLPPLPTKLSVLSRLQANIPITSIIDVGVNEATAELIESFPNIKHFLFEPVPFFIEAIEKNYGGINYELFPYALSDENSDIYLVLESVRQDAIVTHSRISKTEVVIDGKSVVSCIPMAVRRFDSLELAGLIDKDFLLKVDVDGEDLSVMRGFGAKLCRASGVIIECTYSTMLDRIAFIQSMGFMIIDMVDITYYGESLYQFDAVLVRNDLINSNIRPSISNFDIKLWKTVQF